MIKMTYEHLASNGFVMAMQKLTANPMDIKTAYQVKKIAEACQKARGNVTEQYRFEVLKKFAKKDEKGEVIEPVSVADEDQAAMAQAQEEFGKRTVEIDRHPISIEKLTTVKISASDLAALDPILVSEES